MNADLAQRKARARAAARSRRAAAHARDADGRLSAAASVHLLRFLQAQHNRPVAGYLPIRTEIDPRPAMAHLARRGPVGVPVIAGAGRPLGFRLWQPDAPLREAAFGVPVPEDGAPMIPEILIVPLLAFDREGCRLGYGGGFYDRTLEALRARGRVLAVGLAYAAQEADALPREATDQPLDAVITEAGVLRFGSGGAA